MSESHGLRNLIKIVYFLQSRKSYDRGGIRSANLALISGRQMSARASTASIFLVAMTKAQSDGEKCSLRILRFFYDARGKSFSPRHLSIS